MGEKSSTSEVTVAYSKITDSGYYRYDFAFLGSIIIAFCLCSLHVLRTVCCKTYDFVSDYLFDLRSRVDYYDFDHGCQISGNGLLFSKFVPEPAIGRVIGSASNCGGPICFEIGHEIVRVDSSLI
jgi:hypothetical protein